MKIKSFTLERWQSIWEHQVGINLVFPGSNLRISTFLTALVSFVLVLFLQKRILWKPLYYAILTVIFFLGLYEIVWYYLAAAAFGYDLRIFAFAALSGWVLLCIREVYPHKPPKLSLVLYGVFVAALVLWVASGFAVNNLGDAQFSVTGEVFNVVSKAALALAFAIHIGTKQ
jgi:FlaA1/EpsC-like NDP-sugar epimerase